mmetsp:Transcript_36076/g.95505  ORF Transcript_36076/g.95505 Transcript_36076/m.95505 type:complete len:341 (-) Transcript_36076:645-1667(-)
MGHRPGHDAEGRDRKVHAAAGVRVRRGGHGPRHPPERGAGLRGGAHQLDRQGRPLQRRRRHQGRGGRGPGVEQSEEGLGDPSHHQGLLRQQGPRRARLRRLRPGLRRPGAAADRRGQVPRGHEQGREGRPLLREGLRPPGRGQGQNRAAPRGRLRGQRRLRPEGQQRHEEDAQGHRGVREAEGRLQGHAEGRGRHRRQEDPDRRVHVRNPDLRLRQRRDLRRPGGCRRRDEGRRGGPRHRRRREVQGTQTRAAGRRRREGDLHARARRSREGAGPMEHSLRGQGRARHREEGHGGEAFQGEALRAGPRQVQEGAGPRAGDEQLVRRREEGCGDAEARLRA